MIIKGGQAGSVGFWSQHLMRTDTNEVARVVEIGGLTADNLPSALREMAALAAGSRSEGNFMYQANINPQLGEKLTPEQWIEAVDTLEKNMGFEGHQRVVVEHVKEGRQHYHVIWNRVDADTLKVADISFNYRTHEATARQLVQEFDLTPTPILSREEKPHRAPEMWEIRAIERGGAHPDQVRQDATEAWRSTTTGQGFIEAIEAQGYIVAQGDRRDYCIVDQAGTAHSMARRIEGAKAADVRERMEDVDRPSLPTVAEARAEQRDRAASMEREEIAPTPARVPAEAQIGEARDVHSPLMVANAVTGALSTLADFLTDFLSFERPKTQNEISRDAAMQEIRAQREATVSMVRIRDSIERGEFLKAEDVQNLTPSQLANISRRGDDQIRQMVEDMERRARLAREFENARER